MVGEERLKGWVAVVELVGGATQDSHSDPGLAWEAFKAGVLVAGLGMGRP